ncbi:melanoma-associated antigen 1-like [Panicum miliaceum]|uniref:Melanoma-associated antigen 1-like n=1 Tax=Panicum miliaceum TaxID=4540 RepID=A0A3L6TCX2_PANMI|nr:melanoma-associated antigen 1-like [Panicum miliaceum]
MATTTSEELAQIGISKEEKDKLVSEVMRYMLFKTHQTSGCPIKREELTGIVTKNYRQRALPTLVINEARDRLAATFGYEMRELQRTRAPATRSGRASQPQVNAEAKSYVLVSQLDPEVYRKCVEDKEAAPLSGFSFAVISLIHLAGGKSSEGKLHGLMPLSSPYQFPEDLWRQLKRLGLKENDENDPILGNNKQALELLVQQRYLLKEKLAGPEGHVVMYELAERALDESISGKLEDYISQGICPVCCGRGQADSIQAGKLYRLAWLFVFQSRAYFVQERRRASHIGVVSSN